MENTTTIDNKKLAIKYMLISSFLFSFTGGFAKALSLYMSSIEVVFFRNLSGVIIILYLIYKSPLKQKGGKPFLLFMRGLIGFSALLMYFYNIAHIPLAEALTFSKVSPIFTAIFSYFLLKEKLSYTAWCGIFIGFFGVLFITGFDIASLSKTDWLGILSGIGAGLAYTSIRELRKHYESRAIVLSFMTVGTVGPIILLIVGEFYTSQTFDWVIAPFVMPTGWAWFHIVGLGIFATLSQMYMTKAYSLAQGGIVGTISYTTILFSVAVGMLLGDMFPSFTIIVGICFIVLSGLLVAKK
ncbi:MAG: EamA family transporter [Epsilonproteobacteria bacterium]|nr:MAG: EamA family transporter [Campylobacterota bacterium]